MGGRLVEGPTMARTTLDWEAELRGWLEPFLERLGHKARRRMCPLYVSGLIGPGDRKSVQPMAERLAPNDYDQLHHFIAGGVWDLAPLERELLIQADRLVGGSDAVLVIDDTAVPKKGKHSVGVAAQYASALGKNANCQTLVSLTLARGEVPVMVALRLFLPETWTSDPARLKRTGVPIAYRVARTKPEIALAEIDRMISAGVRFGCVLADAGYGMSAPFRQRLTARKLAWAVGIPRHLKVYPVGVRLIWPMTKGRGRPRKRRVPDILSMPAEDMLAGAKWRTVSWRSGTKGRLKARFAAVRVRIADGPPQRIWDKGQQHLPGDEAWLIGEHRVSGEKKCYLANLPAGMDLRSLAATIKARWVCEQAHQQLKEELGLDHFEGRSWHGLHRHALMTMIAYAFLQHRRLAKVRREKKNQRPAASTDVAGRPARHRRSHHAIKPSTMSVLPNLDRHATAA
jgi:SRSO17 transposase